VLGEENNSQVSVFKKENTLKQLCSKVTLQNCMLIAHIVFNYFDNKKKGKINLMYIIYILMGINGIIFLVIATYIYIHVFLFCIQYTCALDPMQLY